MAGSSGFAAIRSVLSHPDYLNYTIGNACSHFGTWVQRVAVGWLTWELTESGAWLGVIAFAEMFPMVLLAPLGGAVADRVERLPAVRLTQSLAMVQSVALCALTYTGLISIYYLLGLALFLGTVMAFNQPVRLAIVPSLVPREDLASAIGISSLSFNFARVGGPAVAGFLIVTWGVAPAFAFNAATFLIFIVTLFMIKGGRSERRHVTTPIRNIPKEIMEGFRYCIRHPGIAPLLVVLTAVSLFGRPLTELLPGFAAQVFGRGAEGLAMLTSTLGAGGVLGGIWLSMRGAVAGLTTRVIASSLVIALGLLAFTATEKLWIALPCIAVVGFAMVTVGVGEQTLLQNAVHGHMRGRVLSLYGMIARGGPALGALMMGTASSYVGLRWPVAVGAAGCLVLWLWARPRRVRMARALEGEPDTA